MANGCVEDRGIPCKLVALSIAVVRVILERFCIRAGALPALMPDLRQFAQSLAPFDSDNRCSARSLPSSTHSTSTPRERPYTPYRVPGDSHSSVHPAAPSLTIPAPLVVSPSLFVPPMRLRVRRRHPSLCPQQNGRNPHRASSQCWRGMRGQASTSLSCRRLTYAWAKSSICSTTSCAA